MPKEQTGTTRKTPDAAPVWAGSTAPPPWGSRSPLALGHPIASNPPRLPRFSAVTLFSPHLPHEPTATEQAVSGST